MLWTSLITVTRRESGTHSLKLPFQSSKYTWWSGPLLRMACTSHLLYWKCLFFKLFSIWSNWWFVHVMSYKPKKFEQRTYIGEKKTKGGKKETISCLLLSPPLPPIPPFSQPTHLFIYILFFRFKLLHILPKVTSFLWILTIFW